MKPQDKELRQEAQARISSAVRGARARLGISQAKAASDSGITEEFLGRIERAEALPSIPTLMRLGQALDINPADLVLEAGDSTND